MLQELRTPDMTVPSMPTSGSSVVSTMDNDADQEYLLALATANQKMAENQLRGKNFILARDHAILSETIMNYLVSMDRSKTSMQASLAKTQTLLLKSLVKKRAYRDAGNVQLRLNRTVKMLG